MFEYIMYCVVIFANFLMFEFIMYCVYGESLMFEFIMQGFPKIKNYCSQIGYWSPFFVAKYILYLEPMMFVHHMISKKEKND